MMNDLRVALCGVGDVGHYAIRGILSRPDMTLVGVQTFSPNKAGRDAAEVIGWDPCGTQLTTSLDDVLAQRPDALLYCGKSRSYEPVLPYLQAGVDVAYLGIPELLHPPSCPPEIREPIEKAALAGGASIMYGGIDPGFSTQLLPFVLSGVSELVDHLTLYEVRDYDPLPLWRLNDLGLGLMDTSECRFFRPGVLDRTWGSSLRGLADVFGCPNIEVAEFRETHRCTDAIDVPARHVEVGAVSAIRFGVTGTVDGVERFRLEHVNRLRRDEATHWRHRQGYGVEIRGVPDYDLHLSLRDPAGKQDRPALFGTAMYNVNILPALIAAEPGIRTPFELAVTGCRNIGGPRRDDNWKISPHLHAQHAGG
jgi:4-hydroxy-tetrahydrodipicolinate reductase